MGEERTLSGGVGDHGPYAAEGPVTWEALASPRPSPVFRRAGDPSPTPDPSARARVGGRRGTAHAPAAREVGGQGNRSHGRRRQGVGGRPPSVDVGERRDARTRPSTGSPCRGALVQGPLVHALTLGAMSRGLHAVVGCRHESPRRRSRMVDLSSSGSGEGLGSGHRPAYSTTAFSTARVPLPLGCVPAPTPRSRTAAGSSRPARAAGCRGADAKR